MTRPAIHRVLAVGVSAALLASLAVTAMAAPAAAATPKCQGFKATIVGNNKANVIKGTPKRDVIVARGGNDKIYGKGGKDIICAGSGKDTVYGGRANDRIYGGDKNDNLFGGAGKDLLDGGKGADACYTQTDGGKKIRCEESRKIIAIAYSNLDRLSGFDASQDVLIAKLVDTDGNGLDRGDRVVMGRYPTEFKPGSNDFHTFGKTSHTIKYGSVSPTDVQTHDASGAGFRWMSDYYGTTGYDEEPGDPSGPWVFIGDAVACPSSSGDAITVKTGAPSLPPVAVSRLWIAPPGGTCDDQPFIDVDIYK